MNQEYGLFGFKVMLPENVQVDLELQGEKIASVIRKINLIEIDFLKDTGIGSMGDVVSLTIKKNTHISVNLQTKKGSSTIPVSASAYQIILSLSEIILTPSQEIVFIVSNPSFNTQLSVIALGKHFIHETLSFSSTVIAKTISPDLYNQELNIEFTSDISQIDQIFLKRIAPNPPERVIFNQKLLEHKIFIDKKGNTKTVVYPELGYFPVHPDCFDQKKDTVLKDKSLAQIKYSFALINGLLCFAKSFDGTAKQVYWQDIDGNTPAVLLLNFLDVNGFPIVFRAAEKNVNLLFRKGINTLMENVTDPTAANYQDFQKTIPGISIDSISNGTLHTLSYTTISWERKEKQLYGQKAATINEINDFWRKPFWLKDNGEVIIDETPPDIICGMSKGTWLNRKNGVSNNVSLMSESIRHKEEPIYHFIRLQVNSDHWELAMQYEERETHKLADTTKEFIFSERNFTAPQSKLINLPATDYLFGASNIYQPVGLIESEIQKNIRIKIEDINTEFREFGFIANDQEHIQGFTRKNASAEKINLGSIFLQPFTRAENPLDAVTIPPSLANKTVDFVHGDFKGKDSLGDRIADETLNVAEKLRKIQQIWNDYIFLLHEGTDETIRKLAENVWELRKYFENLTEEADPSSSRVQFILPDGTKQFYRLRFEKIAELDPAKEKWLQLLKSIVNGDHNKIPGLGKRVHTIRKEINKWKVPDLEKRWNTNWEITIQPDQKIIHALLDFIYKQCDRTLLNQLVELAVLMDITNVTVEKAVSSARELLRYVGLITKTTIEDIKKEIDQLKQGALLDVKEIVTEAVQGLDPYFGKLKSIWDEIENQPCAGIISQEVYARYGSKFDLKNYKRLLADVGSPDSTVKETAKKIMRCLEGKLKEIIKKELLGKWRDLSKTWDDKLKAWIKENFVQYEEDITSFYFFILRVVEIKNQVQNYIALFNKIKNAKTTEEIIALSSDPAFKEVYNLLADVIREEYGDELKKISTVINEEIRKEIDEHREKIVSIATLILQVHAEIKLWEEQIIAKLKSTIDKLKTEWINFVEDFLKNHAKQLEVFLDAIVNYCIEKYITLLSLPDLRIEPPQYLVFGKHISFNTDNTFSSKIHTWLKALHLRNFKLCDLGDKSRQWNFSLSEHSIYILKLGNDMDFTHILQEINDNNKKPGLPGGPFDDIDKGSGTLKLLIESLHPDINTKNWRGLFVVNPVADLSNDNLIRDLLGKAHIKMVYAAVGGTRYEEEFPGLNIYARIKEETPKINVKLDGDNDAELTLIKFDAVIRNTTLESGNALLELNYNKFLGLKPSALKRTVYLYGNVPPKQPGDNSPRDFEFGVTFHPPFELTNEKDGKLGFIEKISLSGIKAIRQAGRSVLDINALMKFTSFDPIKIVKDLTLRNFYIILPSNKGKENPAGKPRGVSFDIGAIEFTINKPRPINFFGLELLPKAVGYWKKIAEAIKNGFANGIMWIGKELDSLDPAEFSFLKVDIDFGKLPRLGGSISGSLKLDAYIGFKSINGLIQGDKPYFGVQGVTGKNISIDLFRFISLYIERLLIKEATLSDSGGRVTFIGAENIKLKILDWSPLPETSKLSIAFLHNHPQRPEEIDSSPQKAFIAAYSNDQPSEGFLRIFWLLVAQNLVVDPKVLNRLISPSTLDDESEVNRVVGEIFNGVEANNIPHLSFDTKPGWLLGASFAVGNILDRCSLILHDDHYYGIMLSSKQSWFENLFGTDKFALSYIPGPTKRQDRFRVEFGLPKLDLISNLKSGLVALEYAINRDFLVDFGFPWRSGNTYLWHRTFSLITGIYETRFGFYFEKRTVITQTGERELTIGAGVALSYGYGLRASVGFAYAEAGIGITAILMGAVTFSYRESVLKSSIKRIDVIGVIGIYGYVRGGINYWIITAEIRAEIVAALAGHLIYEPHGNSSLTFSATLSVKFYASARLKLGFVKITVTVSGRLDYGVSGRIALN